MNQQREQDRVVLITGAARRIRASIARYLHQKGFRIAIHYHQSQQAAETLATELNHQRPDSCSIMSSPTHRLLKSCSFATVYSPNIGDDSIV